MGREARPGSAPGEGETVIEEGWRIAVAPNASEYLVGVAKDFQDYLSRAPWGSSRCWFGMSRAGEGGTSTHHEGGFSPPRQRAIGRAWLPHPSRARFHHGVRL